MVSSMKSMQAVFSPEDRLVTSTCDIVLVTFRIYGGNAVGQEAVVADRRRRQQTNRENATI